ncbi:MAG: hypothetical protein K2P93_01095 [Alphaproteobacteria bacterium]|nr:hypothetical protein [Alphaproteobacteria bacterium]
MFSYRHILIVAISLFFPSYSSWGMNEAEQEEAQRRKSSRELSKHDFFALHSDIKVKKPVPRPSPELFSLLNLDPKIAANLQTFDPPELEKRDFLMFHGVNMGSFGVGGFRELYGDYIDFTAPSLTKMLLCGLWSNVCTSASLIHPSKSPTWAPQGLILRVPYQLIYLADYKDVPRTTHAYANYEIRTFGSYSDRNFQRKAILSRDDCLEGTTETWHNEIQFVPEAMVDGVLYSITVTGLWARDKADERIVDRLYCGESIPRKEKWRPDIVSSSNLANLKEMSLKLEIPLILASEWKKNSLVSSRL